MPSEVQQDALVRAPGRWPLLGHLVPLARSRMGFLTGLSGLGGGLVEVRLGSRIAHVVTDPDLLWRMLVTDASHFDKGQMFDRARQFIGNGLATADAETHRRHRRMLQPAFHRERVSGYVDTMRETARRTLAGWRDGLVVDMVELAEELALTAVARLLFGAEMTGRALAVAREQLPVVIGGTLARGLVPDALEWLPLPDAHRHRRAVRELRQMIGEMVARYRGGNEGPGELLATIMSSVDEQTGRRLSDEQVHDEVLSFLLAGVENPGAALCWVFHELAGRPEVEAAVHAELDAVLGTRAPGYADAQRLEYLLRVISEVLRLYAPMLLMRRVTRPVRLGGVDLPVGSELIFSPYAVHRDPRWFPDPDRFDPDRWRPERAGGIPRGAYLPFGAGERTCIAAPFAMTEITVFAAVIASRWRLLPGPGGPTRPVAHGVALPDQLRMVCRAR